jgi:DNA-binding SARP family transcriptional activator
LIADDPITRLLLTGQATTVHEVEAQYLRDNVDEVCEQVLALAERDLTDEEFSRQLLILLLRAHGSRRWEDSLR